MKVSGIGKVPFGIFLDCPGIEKGGAITALAANGLAASTPDITTAPSNIKFVGVSLGAIVGSYYLASNTTLSPTGAPYSQTTLGSDMKGFLNNPGGRTAYLIQKSPDGHAFVQGAEARKAVMDLRLDPHAASLMAGELTSDHASYLRGRVGRDPTAGELYAAHFLGPQGSAKLIEAVQDPRPHRHSVSQGIPGLRRALAA